MKHSILYSAISAAMAISLAACSSDSDVAGTAGTEGTSITSTGTITGFGSVYVNDTRYDTSSSTFNVDGNPDGTEDDLAIGMRVTVKGTIDADGINGVADSIEYDDELQGPVSSVTPGADADNKTVTVLGVTVALNRTTTRFDTSDSSSSSFDFDSIDVGNSVEISGYPDSNNQLIATRVELEDQNFIADDSEVELKGTITGLTGLNTFNLEEFPGITVDAASADIDDLPGGLVDGAFVEVEGTCPDVTCTTIDAKSVEAESESYDSDGDGDVEIEGIITRYVSNSDFDVDGRPVDASNAQFEPSTLVLAPDLLVEVEGTVVNNVLIATKVELED